MPTISVAKSTPLLQSKVNQTVAKLRRKGLIERSDRTAWSVYDFSTSKKLVSINEDIPLQCASMVKPIIALAFLRKYHWVVCLMDQRARQNYAE